MKKFCCKLYPKVFLLPHIYLLNKKELHMEALNKKYNISELQVLFIKVILKQLPFSFGFLLCYRSLHNENFIFSASCAVMASSTQFAQAATSPETISSVIFTAKIPHSQVELFFIHVITDYLQYAKLTIFLKALPHNS